MQNYEWFVERIAKSAGLEVGEVEERIEAKKEKLSGLISKEGAAQIIAAELGINFEDQNLKISEIATGMRRINVIGEVINLFPVREYERNGRAGKVANFILADDTGNLRAVLWDVNQIALIESGEIKKGDTVEIKNCSSREGEIHLSSFSEIKKSSKVIEGVKVEEVVAEKALEEVSPGRKVRVRSTVVQMFQPRFYFVCPECKKKVVSEDEKFNCVEHGEVEPEDRAILNFVVDDGTENMRVVMFSEQINLLIPEAELKDAGKFSLFKDDFLGSEIYVEGIVKRNQLFNNLEIVVSNVKKVDVEKLVESFEKG